MIKFNRNFIFSNSKIKFNLNYNYACKNILKFNTTNKFLFTSNNTIKFSKIEIEKENYFGLDKTIKNKENLKFDIFENRKDFELYLLDNPIGFLNILNENLRINLIKNAEDFLENERKQFSEILNIIGYFLENVSKYENDVNVFTNFKELVEKLAQEIAYNNNLKNLQILLQTFIKTKITKLKDKNNIYVLYFLHSLIAEKMVKMDYLVRFNSHKIINESRIFLDEELDFVNRRSFDNLEPIYEYLISVIPKIYKDFSVFNKYKIFLSEEGVPEITTITSELTATLFYAVYAKILPMNYEINSTFATLDDNLSEYIKSGENWKLIEYLLISFTRTKKRVMGAANLILPFTFSTLCRIFNFSNPKNKQKYYNLHMDFIRANFKESHTVRNVNNLFQGNIFHAYEFFLENYKNMSTRSLIEQLYFFGYVKFQVDNKIFEEAMSRMDEIFKHHERLVYLLITACSLMDNPNMEFYRRALTEVDIVSIGKKRALNIGFYSAIAKFDDINLWRNYIKKIQNFDTKFNFLDIKMLKDMQCIFRLIGPQYKEFDIYFNKFILRETNDFKSNGFHRWFHSGNLGNSSLAELPLEEYLKNKKIKFTSQFKIGDGLHSIDYLIGDKIAVEINGPAHYFTSNRLKMDVKTKLKKEIIESYGYYPIFINVLFMNADDIFKITEMTLQTIKNNVPSEEFQKIFTK